MTEYATLQEHIDAERIVKATANPRSFKQLGRNPQSLNFSLVIQRNLRWDNRQKSKLIESVLLGYPIPPVYAVKSNDNVTWVLDGKQRIEGAIIPFMNDLLELSDLDPVYGVDINGLKFSQLPEEFQEILEEERINVYQFERLSPAQQEEFFTRMNSGTPLLSVEVTRSILGAELLTWITTMTDKPLFKMMGLTPKGIDKFLDQEIVLQLLGIMKGDYSKLSGKSLQALALDFRINGISDETKEKFEQIIDYIAEGFEQFEEKQQKKLLKKNDVIGLFGASLTAIELKVEAKTFAWQTALIIPKQSGEYKNTKVGGTNKADNVKKRVEILIKSFMGDMKDKEDDKDTSPKDDDSSNKEDQDSEGRLTQETITEFSGEIGEQLSMNYH